MRCNFAGIFSKKYKCPKCGQIVDIRDKGNSHAFFCDSCHYPLFWNAATGCIETDTLRSKQAHSRWAKATRCPKCGKVVEVRDKNQSHAFFCNHCRCPIYWNAGKWQIEADTIQARKAHDHWASVRAKRQSTAAKAAGGSGCVLYMLLMLVLAVCWYLLA